MLTSRKRKAKDGETKAVQLDNSFASLRRLCQCAASKSSFETRLKACWRVDHNGRRTSGTLAALLHALFPGHQAQERNAGTVSVTPRGSITAAAPGAPSFKPRTQAKRRARPTKHNRKCLVVSTVTTSEMYRQTHVWNPLRHCQCGLISANARPG